MASDMAATDACTAEWITVSSNALSICVTMVGISVTAGVDEGAAGSAVVAVAPSVCRKKNSGESLHSFRPGTGGNKMVLLQKQAN